MKALATNLCNNILVTGKEENISITPMKLQKLMYFVCRDYVQATGESPIAEPFEVWKYGPVLPSVLGEFRTFGSKQITEFAKDAMGCARKVSESKNPILSQVIDIVWAKYKRYTGSALSAMTHERGSGWYSAYMSGREKITLEDMENDKTGK